MSGTISICMQQQVDRNGAPLIGGLLYMYAAGTTTPQNGYRDAALSSAYPNPITLDASGRIPSIFFADGVVRIRLTDQTGVLQFDADNLPVIGSSAGGGGVDTTDLNALYNTGDLKCRYGTGVLAGYVRCNARTIGSATSGATERANADCQALFQYLWNNDANLPVTPSRGASAVADWGANKQIATPDFRGRVLAGLDDMGSSAAGRLTASYFGNGTVLGAAGGVQAYGLQFSDNAPHQHFAYISDPTHTHIGAVGGTGGTGYPTAQPSGLVITSIGASATGVRIRSTPTGAADDLTAISGSGTPHNNVQPTMIITVYIRL